MASLHKGGDAIFDRLPVNGKDRKCSIEKSVKCTQRDEPGKDVTFIFILCFWLFHVYQLLIFAEIMICEQIVSPLLHIIKHFVSKIKHFLFFLDK